MHASVAAPPVTPSIVAPVAEGVATIFNVSWQQFQVFDAIFAERRGVKLSYCNGVLEIMSPVGRPHEKVKSNLGVLLETYCRFEGLRCYRVGSPTLQEPGYASVEPDESYCLGSDKHIPDIVIEVVVTSGVLDKLEIYKVLGVPEVWVWKKGGLAIHALQDGTYRQSQRSGLLPDLDMALLEKCADHPDQYDAVELFRRTLAEE